MRGGRSARTRSVLAGALRVLALYFGAVWVYVALIAVFRQQTLAQPLWHALPHLRRDTAGAISFALSAGCYFLASTLEPET